MMAAWHMEVKQTSTTQNPSFSQIAYNDNSQLTVIRHMEEIISYVELRKYRMPQMNICSNEGKKDTSRFNFEH
jgi:hypothetical protein